ncbi:CalY family protein [Rossellomorea aquimaris]|uniref:CalY family protein n=1 Tax=Rossellomorea aquimaris TaxID=189382 RepID=UPI001CD38534|nr:CalY family protein [Rossellomorea aquimaris]MCA1055232.1 CalY family protein [Rossellomorea aquimaris]
MKKKNKVALLSATGLLATSLAIGGATYALFKDGATNANTVTAGELEITAKRDDVPNVGPMFYSENSVGNYGAMATGEWAPGDKHTRGLFLKNTGTLEARLQTLTATPVDSNGIPVTSGQQYEDDVLFALQSNVKIWDIKRVDPSSMRPIPIPITLENASEMDEIMEVVNAGYEFALDFFNITDFEYQVDYATFVNAVNQFMLEELNRRGVNGGDLYQVDRLYNKKLSQLVNNQFDASSLGLEIKPDEAILLGFTVQMKKNPPAGIDRNSMQGKSVYFNFGTDWVQTRNN